MDEFSHHRLIAPLPAEASQRRVREVLDAGAASVWHDGAPTRDILNLVKEAKP